MQNIGYTDTDQIRAVLGVDTDDLSDEALVARRLASELNLDLLAWLPTHADIIFTGTPEQQDALGLYATYYCAAIIAISLKMAAPQTVSDGKNQMNRFSEASDWEKLQNSLNSRVGFYKKYLLDTLGTTSQSTFKPFSLVTPSYDPVTGA